MSAKQSKSQLVQAVVDDLLYSEKVGTIPSFRPSISIVKVVGHLSKKSLLTELKHVEDTLENVENLLTLLVRNEDDLSESRKDIQLAIDKYAKENLRFYSPRSADT